MAGNFDLELGIIEDLLARVVDQIRQGTIELFHSDVHILSVLARIIFMTASA